MTTPSRIHSKAAVPPAPHWLTRSEKLMFKGIVEERIAAGLSVSAIDQTTIADHVMARTRLRDLRKMLAEGIAEKSELEWDRSYLLALFRELDRVTRLSVTLGDRVSS